jgi:protein TonB
MSSAHTWTVCLILSCFLHWQALGAHWASALSGPSGPQTAVLESRGHFQGTKTAFALHQLLEQTTDGQGDGGENRQEQIRANYLKKINDEINHHKFLGLGSDTAHTIGNARYCFFIDKNGRFQNIRLVKSSGNPIIDRAARAAICHTSQKVKRPDSTGTAAIRLWVTVKYQYGL